MHSSSYVTAKRSLQRVVHVEDDAKILMRRISVTRDRRGDVVIKVQDQSEQPGMSRDQRKV